MSRSRRPKNRAFRSCGNHGGCPWCIRNRTACDARRRSAAAADLGVFARGKAFDPVELFIELHEICE